MTLRQKTLLILGVTFLCLLIVLDLSLSTLWLNGFAKIESQQTQQNVERVTQALADDLMKLDTTAGDWSAWDDTYAFAENGSANYIQENLANSTLANLGLNYMVFINSAGQIIYGKGLNLQQGVTAPVPESLKQYLSANSSLLQYAQVNSRQTGIVLLPEGPLLAALRPIMNSDRTLPSRGTLLLGHFLDADKVKQLARLTRLAIAVYPLQDTRLPSDFQAVRSNLTQKASNAKTQSQPPILVRPLGTERIAGYTLLKDIQGYAGLLLRVDTPRTIYQQGKQGLNYVVGSLLAVGVTFCIVILLLLEKLVLSPLARFIATVRRIRASGSLSGRLLISGNDELSLLGTAINRLLETLQQSQLELSQSQERYQSVVDNVKEVIFQTDATGLWTFLNPAWTELTGFSIEESLGIPCWKFIHPADQPYHCEEFRRLIEGQIQDSRYEIRYQTQDGNCRWFEVHSRRTVASCDASTKFTVSIAGTAGTLNDITDRKLAEARERAKTQKLEQTLQELTQTQAKLIQSEKMSSLGQLVAGIAHEINNPISFVYGNLNHASEYTQNLLHLIHCYQQHYPNPPTAIKEEMETIDFDFITNDLPNLLNSMKVGTERICEIVLSLRNFSRLDESEIKAVDLHEGINSTLLILQHRLKAQGKPSEIQIIKKYGNLPPVECYPGQLNQVFMNLLSNAIDALEEKTRGSDSEGSNFSPCIQICTALNDDHSSLNGQSRAPCVAIRIADNGSGMTETVRRNLFNPFFTTKAIGQGTGLGLSISYQIVVEKHKGQLLVNSELGQGTEFIIELPLQQN